MKTFGYIVLTAFTFLSCKTDKKNEEVAVTHAQEPIIKETIYQFKVKDLNGNEFIFEDLKGKKLMIVNTASKCGLTP